MSNFTVYKSSAGSGKTFTLVKAYLSIALSDEFEPPTKYKSILAITFTNKAAGEMKERIISNLRSIAELGIQDKMGELLCVELKLTSEKISHRAKNLLSEILHNYGEFSVSTIDRFVHRVIRTFALDLRLPLNFSVEMNTEVILARCVDELIGKVGNDERLTEILFQFTRSRVEEDKSWKVENELLKFLRHLIREESAGIIGNIRQTDLGTLMDAKNKMQSFVRSFESRIENIAKKAMEWMNFQGLVHEDFYQKSRGFPSYFQKISIGNFSDPRNSYVNDSVENGKWRSGSSKLTDDHISFLKEKFDELENIRLEGIERYTVFRALLSNIYSMMVIQQLQSILTQIKEEENFVFIAEFNALIAEIIKTEPVPFIYERIGERYKHYLVDEFQDTSVLQWNNLLPLVDNSLAGANFNLVVGDGKQSIYRWRGGDVNQFSDLPLVQGKKNKIQQEREDSLRREYHQEILKINYRSKEKIVGFNNVFFEWLREHKIPSNYKKVYLDCYQEAQKNKPGGFVSYDVVQTIDELSDPDIAVCEKTVDYIRLNLEKNAYSYSDITVLVRTKKKGKLIADFLLSENIPIVSSETLLLNSNPSVSFILALLKLVQSERDEMEEAIALKYLTERNKLGSKNFEELWKLFHSRNCTIWEFLASNQLTQFTRAHFSALPLFELCCLLVREFKPDVKDDLFVQFFLDEVIKYSRNNPENLSSFLDWWQEQAQGSSAILPSGADAINIMTIHTAKGLQFPVVIIPFADWDISKTDPIWFEVDEPEIPQINLALVNSHAVLRGTKYELIGNEEKEKQILDNVNLLYVATTRAEDHLHLISRNRNNSNFVDAWLREFFPAHSQVDSSGNSYHLGEMSQKMSVQKPAAKTISYALHLTDRSDIVELKMSMGGPGDLIAKNEKLEFGILFHKAMSRVYKIEDAYMIRDWLVSKALCVASKAEELQTKILQLMKRDIFTMLFQADDKSMNEPELLTPEGDYRPDRIVFKSDQIFLVEYKTGVQDEKHIEQIRNYSIWLEQIFSLKVRNFLIYVEDEIVLEID